jgi:TonB family protein
LAIVADVKRNLMRLRRSIPMVLSAALHGVAAVPLLLLVGYATRAAPGTDSSSVRGDPIMVGRSEPVEPPRLPDAPSLSQGAAAWLASLSPIDAAYGNEPEESKASGRVPDLPLNAPNQLTWSALGGGSHFADATPHFHVRVAGSIPRGGVNNADGAVQGGPTGGVVNASNAGDAVGPGSRAIAGHAGATRSGPSVPLAGNAAPTYPAECRRARSQGSVRLRFEIRPDGGTDQIAVAKSSGILPLDMAVLQVVKTWRFEPGGALAVVEQQFDFVLK